MLADLAKKSKNAIPDAWKNKMDFGIGRLAAVGKANSSHHATLPALHAVATQAIKAEFHSGLAQPPAARQAPSVTCMACSQGRTM